MSDKKYLDALYIYPIKSLPGVRLEHAEVTQKGLKHDRRWMLVDKDLQFITVRKNRKLIHFDMHMTSLGLEVGTKFHKSILTLPFSIEEGNRHRAKIWEDEVEVIEGQPGWNEWFSEVLGEACMLVFMPEESQRPIKEKWQVNKEQVSLADGYPYLITTRSSMHELNVKMGKELDIERFRPNIVIEGTQANEEYLWSDFSIGEVEFKGLKPCERCVVTTIDPKTGDMGKEPLQTLAKEKVDNKVVFGQHALTLTEGTIRIGDLVEVKSTKKSPYDPL